jgi:hypothetical protein
MENSQNKTVIETVINGSINSKALKDNKKSAGAVTISIMTLSIMTLSIMTPSIKDLIATLRIRQSA